MKCTVCGEAVTGNHAVRDGDRYCFGCRDALAESATTDTNREYETPPTLIRLEGGRLR